MGLLDVVVLDVGHASCAVVHGSGRCAVVDAGFSATLYEYLAQVGITKIDVLFLSHADADHIGGVASLLAGPILVGELYVNPDGKKQTKAWRTLRTALKKMRKAGSGIKTHCSLNVADPGVIDLGPFIFQVLSPDEVVQLGGGAGSKVSEKALSANDCSAILRLCVDDVGVALFAADATEWSWKQVEEEISDPKDRRAQILIVPHHGGGFGDPATFKALLSDVQPKYAVVSNGRNKHQNPNPAVVDAMTSNGIRVFCTQLGLSCGSSGGQGFGHLPARGSTVRESCYGSIVFRINAGVAEAIEEVAHREFVDLLPSPLCHRTQSCGLPSRTNGI